MPDPAHCDARMKMARLIPGFKALPELLVFRCSHCGHVETIERPLLKRDDPTKRFLCNSAQVTGAF